MTHESQSRDDVARGGRLMSADKSTPSGLVIRSLNHRRLRSNPGFDAVAVDDLPSEHRTSIESIAGGNVCAVLRSRDTGEYATGLDRETAALFHSLVSPQAEPALLAGLASWRRYRTAARLICDQVLQIEQTDGSFADGVLAHEILFGNGIPSETGSLSDQLDRLSRAAIDHAVVLHSESSVALARRLYAFHATPRTQRWDALLGDSVALARWLGVAPRAAWLQRLSPRYDEHGSIADETSWLQWIRKNVDPRTSMRYKIYVSPATEQLAEVLPVVGEVCCAMDVPAFKIGATLLGILRPDKLVVYVEDEPALRQVAAELRCAVAGFEPHGVPFTAPIDPAGLLSWAIDPEEEALLRPIDQPWSWRTAVAGRLADSIARAKGHDRDAVVVDFALERLRLDGIEPIGWRPGEGW